MRVDRSELRWAALAALAVMAATLLPYLLGWLITPPGQQYSWFLSNSDEHNVYLSWMKQAGQGHFFLRDLFTTEPQHPRFFHLMFWKMGVEARLFGLAPITLYQLARMVAGWLLLFTLYLLVARFTDSVPARRISLLLAAVSSGLGWLVAAPGLEALAQPVDVGRGLLMPEAITFLTLLLNPLFAASVWLLESAFLLLLLSLERRSWKLALAAGAVGLMLGNIHSYDMLTFYLVAMVFLAAMALAQRRFPWPQLGLAAVVVAISLPTVLYQASLMNEPVYRQVHQTETLSPPIRDYLVSFGLPLLLALVGAVYGVRRLKDDGGLPPSITAGAGSRTPQGAWLLLPIWLVVHFALLYAPASLFPFQRKLAEGIHLPMVMLAGIFLGEWLWPRARWACALLMLLTVPSNILFLNQTTSDLVNGYPPAVQQKLMPPLHLSAGAVAAMQWIGRHSRPGQAVLCDPRLGSYLPGIAGRPVFIGHWAETLDYPRKLGALSAFLTGGMSDSRREDLARENRIGFVLTEGENPSLSTPLFEPAFRAGDFSVYRVRSAGDAINRSSS